MIREAVLVDVPRIVEMGAQFLRESSYAAVIADSPSQMTTLATQLITSEAGAVFVADDSGALVGMLGLMCGPHFLSGEITAGEIFWWVEPAARGVGVRLLKAGEQWAIQRGAVSMQMIAPNEHVGTFYERIGYRPIERSYFRRLDDSGLRRRVDRSPELSGVRLAAAVQ